MKLSLKKSIALLFVGAILTFGISRFISSVQADDVIFHNPPPCQLSTQPGDILVDFGAQYLLTTDPNYPPIYRNTNIPAGYYDIYLQSFDGYNLRVGVTQPWEQYLVLFNNSGEIAKTNATSDLADYVEIANWQGKVNSDLFLSKNITQAVAQHAHYGDGSQGANSVRAICMVARPLNKNVCGDGIKSGDEQCDDGNTKNGDGCNSTCKIEEETPRCGDGKINQSTEKCDDGNTNNNDGCSSTCQIESCGDGIKQTNEQCDDGNKTNGDGCSATCENEKAPVCGDGIINQASEQCDDGNTVNGDGCDLNCKNETPNPYCGDGIKQSGEECDDGNNKNDDGCSSTCKEEEEEEEEDCDSSIGDQIWYDLNKNGKQDANEKGISGVTLKLIFGNKVKKDTTNSAGEYKFKDLCKGDYKVVADAKDIPDGCYQVYDPDGKLDNTDKVQLDKDEKHKTSDFGYYCPNVKKTPATGPGIALTSIFSGLVGMSALAVKKRKFIIQKLKK